jgi:hypothetical protein
MIYDVDARQHCAARHRAHQKKEHHIVAELHHQRRIMEPPPAANSADDTESESNSGDTESDSDDDDNAISDGLVDEGDSAEGGFSSEESSILRKARAAVAQIEASSAGVEFNFDVQRFFESHLVQWRR